LEKLPSLFPPLENVESKDFEEAHSQDYDRNPNEYVDKDFWQWGSQWADRPVKRFCCLKI